jgi:hypothetical protein
MTGATIEDDGEIIANSNKGYYLVYEVRNLKTKQVFFFKHNNTNTLNFATIYLITYATREENFDKHIEEFDVMVRTFKFAR